MAIEHNSLISDLAKKIGVEPEALAAVMKVESPKGPFEPDGVTPTFLFEKHRFFANLDGEKRALAVASGLARKNWVHPLKGGYADQKTAGQRLDLLKRARAIDIEAANRSASWGRGQIMGENAKACGFKNASTMVVAFARGEEEQITAMATFIASNSKMVSAMRAKDWATFARLYNGPGYKANRYDTKLAAAYADAKGEFDPGQLPVEPKTLMSSKTVISGAGITLASVLGVVDQAKQAVDQVIAAKDSASNALDVVKSLSLSPAFIACSVSIVVIGLALFIMRERILKLREGI